MLFNSLEFVLFLPLVVGLYFLTPFRWRWALLLAASYYFYACWRVEYLGLIVISTAIDYLAALAIERASRSSLRRLWLLLSVSTNLGILFFFKYYDFFVTSLGGLPGAINVLSVFPKLEVLLPVGISFYTFQSMSYTIDVYRRRLPAERHFGVFCLYVSFFPQLVAGPIERSTALLPQFARRHSFDSSRLVSGLELVLWGFFQKLVVADRLAEYVNRVFGAPEQHAGLSAWIGMYFFAFQIYCDFSSYTNIARGSARMMGFELMENFRQPYLAPNLADFWRRWHISLSTWFRDYLYIPLGGKHPTRWKWYRNLLVVFLLSGLWHGANWTFVIWGALHGGLLVLLAMRSEPLRAPRWLKVLFTFHVVCLAWVFFRAESVGQAMTLLQVLMSKGTSLAALTGGRAYVDLIVSLAGLGVVLAVDWIKEHGGDRLPALASRRAWRWAASHALLLGILLFNSTENPEFIYFQF